MSYYSNRNAENAKKYKLLAESLRQKLEKDSPRKEITQKKGCLYSTFPSVIKEAKEFAKEWKKSIDDIRIEHSCYQQEYSDSYSSEMHFEVQGLETDEQYHARLMESHENTQYREEHERKEFQRLSAKFNK